ncbi:MAG: GntR family transcriptional regulator [Thermoflexaceae bacterium]|nr:GntR family transcriptional regulator [Thermoflexaceae bacterium]
MEFKANVPIYVQVINDIKKQIVCGRIELGEKLPSTRELAVRYQVNPNTAVRIYNEMELEGICFTKRGLGTFVTEDKAMYESMKKEMAQVRIEEYVLEMKELGYTKENMIRAVEDYFERG